MDINETTLLINNRNINNNDDVIDDIDSNNDSSSSSRNNSQNYSNIVFNGDDRTREKEKESKKKRLCFKLPPKESVEYIRYYVIGLIVAGFISIGVSLLFVFLDFLPFLKESRRYQLSQCTVIDYNIITISSNTSSHSCKHYNNNIWWFSQQLGSESQFFRYVSNGSADSGYGSSSDDDSSADINDGLPCYYGENYINLAIIDHHQQQPGPTIEKQTIYGLTSESYSWVSNYVNNFQINSSYACYYDILNHKHVLWFHPLFTNVHTLLPFCFFGGLSIILFLLSICFASLSRVKVSPIPDINSIEEHRNYLNSYFTNRFNTI